MKKQYISPEAVCEQMLLESLLNGASVGNVDSDTTNPIELGGDAGEDEESASRRRRDIWADEELDEDCY